MKKYTDEEKEKIGQEIALLFGMRKSHSDKGRFITSWGTKSGIGIFEMIQRVNEEIKTGTIQDGIA